VVGGGGETTEEKILEKAETAFGDKKERRWSFGVTGKRRKRLRVLVKKKESLSERERERGSRVRRSGEDW
jgi:hypothetical protein